MQPELTMGSADTATEFAKLLHEHRKIVFKVAASFAWEKWEQRTYLFQTLMFSDPEVGAEVGVIARSTLRW